MGWVACVVGIGIALALGALLATRLIAARHRGDAASVFQLGQPNRHGGSASWKEIQK